MHYLPCNHCGHLNRAISEYTVLCENCGKKMANSYPHWRESRSHGSYGEYLAECCLSGESLDKHKEAKRQQEIKRKKTRRVAMILGVISIVFIGISLIAYGGIIKRAFLNAIHSGNELNWTEQRVGTEGLVLNFPKTFENADALIDQLPPTAISHFEKLEASIAGFNKNFIAVAFSMVTNEPDTGNLKRYAEFGLDLLTGSRMVDKTEIKIEKLTIDNNPAILQRGTFKDAGEKSSDFTLILVGKERNFWLIMVVSPTDDGKAKRITKKFVRSIRIRPEEY